MDQGLNADIALAIGPALQAGGAALLFVLFLLLGANAGRRPYFQLWTTGWLMLTLGLGVMAFGLWLAPGIVDGSGRQPAWLPVAYLIFFTAKFMYMLAMVLGTLSYAWGRPSARLQWTAVAALLVYASVAAYISDSPHHSVLYQAPVILAGSFVAAWLLFTMPAPRRTLGSNLTGALFTVMTLAWVMYLMVFAHGIAPSEHPWPRLVAFFVDYNWFLNVILHMLTANGMLLILMEDARREIDAAHDELAHAHRELQAESMRDALTSALNRRAFVLGTGLEHAQASFGAVIVLDLDNLKEVNDTYGHAAGDALLVHCVSVLRNGMRPTDKLYRWGGDEFLLVLPRGDADEARTRFCNLVNRSAPAKTESGVDLPLRASVGAAPYTGGTDLEPAIRAADADMYEAKRLAKEAGEA